MGNGSEVAPPKEAPEKKVSDGNTCSFSADLQVGKAPDAAGEFQKRAGEGRTGAQDFLAGRGATRCVTVSQDSDLKAAESAKVAAHGDIQKAFDGVKNDQSAREKLTDVAEQSGKVVVEKSGNKTVLTDNATQTQMVVGEDGSISYEKRGPLASIVGASKVDDQTGNDIFGQRFAEGRANIAAAPEAGKKAADELVSSYESSETKDRVGRALAGASQGSVDLSMSSSSQAREAILDAAERSGNVTRKNSDDGKTTTLTDKKTGEPMTVVRGAKDEKDVVTFSGDKEAGNKLFGNRVREGIANVNQESIQRDQEIFKDVANGDFTAAAGATEKTNPIIATMKMQQALETQDGVAISQGGQGFIAVMSRGNQQSGDYSPKQGDYMMSVNPGESNQPAKVDFAEYGTGKPLQGAELSAAKQKFAKAIESGLIANRKSLGDHQGAAALADPIETSKDVQNYVDQQLQTRISSNSAWEKAALGNVLGLATDGQHLNEAFSQVYSQYGQNQVYEANQIGQDFVKAMGAAGYRPVSNTTDAARTGSQVFVSSDRQTAIQYKEGQISFLHNRGDNNFVPDENQSAAASLASARIKEAILAESLKQRNGIR